MKRDIKWVVQQLELIADKHQDLEVVDISLVQFNDEEWMGLGSYGFSSRKELNVTMRTPNVDFVVPLK